VTNAVPPDYQKFVLEYRPIKRNPNDVSYCKDMLEQHTTALANPASNLRAIANPNIGLSCLTSEQIVIKWNDSNWTFRGFGEYRLSFYSVCRASG
jgi:hypothetical protein